MAVSAERVQVQGLGFRVPGSGLRNQGLGFRILGVRTMVHGLGLKNHGFAGFRVQESSGLQNPEL